MRTCWQAGTVKRLQAGWQLKATTIHRVQRTHQSGNSPGKNGWSLFRGVKEGSGSWCVGREGRSSYWETHEQVDVGEFTWLGKRGKSWNIWRADVERQATGTEGPK